MKKTLTMMLLAFGMKASAQQEQSYEQMSKMQLTKIYLEQVQKLALAAPYASFTVTDTTGVIDMPTSKYLKNKRDAVTKVTNNFNKTINVELYEVVPYADKAQIIQAIQFLENINSVIK
jgi:DNA polymerase III delta prime subunit